MWHSPETWISICLSKILFRRAGVHTSLAVAPGWVNFMNLAPSICGSSAWNLRCFVALLAPRILRWLPDFLENLCTPNIEYMELVQNDIFMVQQRGRSVVMGRAVTLPVELCRNARRFFFFLEEHASGLKAEASAYNTTWCHNPKDHSHHIPHLVNMKTYSNYWRRRKLNLQSNPVAPPVHRSFGLISGVVVNRHTL
jgi:hypothetical protein